MGTLFLVATPIGNLEDMSPRAVRLLGSVGLIAAEDTRQTLKLLNHFGLHTRLTSYYEHNRLSRLDEILAALAAGDVALVSDAGTPAINDPGVELVRAALAAGHTVCPVPGPSAPVAALSASGLSTDAFLYLGYLPRRAAERRAVLAQVAGLPYTLVFLETPHRLLEALEDLRAVLGDRQMAAARELTKLHEEFVRGPVSAVQAHFAQQAPRGEFVLLLAGGEAVPQGKWDEDRLRAAVESALAAGRGTREIASDLAVPSGWKKKELYAFITRHD